MINLIWTLINPNSAAPITGGAASTALRIRRAADGYLFDFSDATFKNSGWTAVSAAFAEVSAVNLPGSYQLSIDPALWNDGVYQFFGAYTGATPLYAQGETRIEDGVEAVVTGTITTGEHTLIAADVQTGLTTQGYTSTRAGYLDTLNGLVANVWGYTTRTLTSFGTLATDIWSAATRTLTAFSFDVTTSTADKNSLVDLVWNEVLTGATHNVTSSAGRRLRQIASNIILDGTAQGPGTGNNQIQLATDASNTDGAYDPGMVYIVAGAGAGQSRIILQYAGATRIATVNRDWKTAVDATSEYVVVAYADLQCVNEGLLRAATSNTAQLNTLAQANDDAYVGQILFLVSGTGQDQAGLVMDYDGTTQTVTISGTWAVTPDTTTGYIMIPASPILLDAVTRSQLTTIYNDVETLTGGAGSRAITVQLYRTATTTPIVGADIAIYNGGGDLVAQGTSDSNGQLLTAINDGTYSVRLRKSGYTFAVASLTVSADATVTLYGTAAVIPAPTTTNACTVYEYCFNQASDTPLASVTATAQILNVPFDADTKLHDRADVTGTYNATTGIISWEIVQGAVVQVRIQEVGVNRRITVPVATTARVTNITE